MTHCNTYLSAPTMSNEDYKTVAKCQLYAVQGARDGHSERISLLSAPGLLEFQAMDILDSFSRPKSQYVVVLPERYMQLSRAMEVATVTSTSAESYLLIPASFCPEIWATMRCGVDNNSCSTLWADIVHISIEPLTTNAYHAKSNDQVGRFNQPKEDYFQH